MSNVEILKKALRAAGHDQALALVDAILGSSESPKQGDGDHAAAQSGAGERMPAAEVVQPEVDVTGLTRADLEVMSAEEINRRWDEVQAALQRGI